MPGKCTGCWKITDRSCEIPEDDKGRELFMKNKLIRYGAVLLALVTAFGAFAGCKKKGGVSDPPKGEKYKIIYENDCKSSFDGAKDDLKEQAGESL
mgnify:CR=1 FL=1